MKRFRAASRWTSPRSIRAHSLASITRGMTSNGHARSMPVPSEYTVNVIPIVRMSVAAAAWRACSSSTPRRSMTARTSSAAGRGSAVAVAHLVPGRGAIVALVSVMSRRL